MGKALSKTEFGVLESVYASTDCSNEVFDWGTLHHSQNKVAERLVKRKLLKSIDGCVSVDGDGFIEDPERVGTGYRLTVRGYEALTDAGPFKYPPSQRRFVPKLVPKAGGKRGGK